MDKLKCLDSLKKTVLEFIKDVEIGIAKGMIEKKMCLAFAEYFHNYSPLQLMNNCVKHMLPHKKRIEEKNDEFLENELKLLFENITGTIFPLDMNIKERLNDPDDKETVWNYLSIILVITEQYKKDQ